MLQVALTFENTVDDILAAASVIEALRRPLEPADETPTAVAPPPPPNAPPTAWNVPAWFNRLGPGSRQFWTAAAQYVLTHPTFTFDDLATATGLSKGTLRSYQRNSYRAIHAENASDPLPQRDMNWDAVAQRNVYRMPDGVRDEILRLTNPTT